MPLMKDLITAAKVKSKLDCFIVTDVVDLLNQRLISPQNSFTLAITGVFSNFAKLFFHA